jgi:hypothetical protein
MPKGSVRAVVHPSYTLQMLFIRQYNIVHCTLLLLYKHLYKQFIAS